MRGARGRRVPGQLLGWPDSLSPLLSPHQARLKFPIDYPYSPPAFRFLTKMWHPNIYEVSMPLGHVRVGGHGDRSHVGADPSLPPHISQTGDVCISILHPPVDDPQSGELPSERWNPTQNVR